MSDMLGIIRPDFHTLPQIGDRMSFLYLERCVLNRQDSAITIKDASGTTFVPAAQFSVFLLGPGTTITHRAMELIGDAGVAIIWVGEKGIRYYASGRPLTSKASLLQMQARLVSNQRLHLQVVRKMYQLRFPGEDISKLTLQQLRGREGARVRAAYREAAKSTGVEWNGREYSPDNFESGTPVNKALSAGNVCLYGLAHAVISALGCSPGLGFVHIGHENSFVYDIADLYKAETVIPLAFKVASDNPDDLPAIMRRKTRDILFENRILSRMVKDIKYLLKEDNYKSDDAIEQNINTDESEAEVYLWDNMMGKVKNGISY